MQTILLGTDLSEHSGPAARWALGLARFLQTTSEPARIIALLVVAPDDLSILRIASGRDHEAELQALTEQLESWCRDHSLDVDEVELRVELGAPRSVLRAQAEALQADWLILGRTGRGRLARFLLGTTAARVGMEPPCKVVVVHPEGFHWDQPLRAIAAIGHLDSSAIALRQAAELAAYNCGTLHLLHVLELPRVSTAITNVDEIPETLAVHLRQHTASLQAELRALIDQLPSSLDALAPHIDIRHGYASAEIFTAQEELQANLIALGVSADGSRLRRWLLGSVGQSVLRNAPCTVLIAPSD